MQQDGLYVCDAETHAWQFGRLPSEVPTLPRQSTEALVVRPRGPSGRLCISNKLRHNDRLHGDRAGAFKSGGGLSPSFEKRAPPNILPLRSRGSLDVELQYME
ncbi:Hypothetical protein SMAX5B_017955 [Scophthalmus maximus]|uniref:Uncharacterized protein n=1 Tax=Scophthalmus maximus TaxID=52904 RepID=A0A2U9CBP0_SCOMX|nr:Hypothetical protein SMAX5B_017955 [Scophthalmus maximus]